MAELPFPDPPLRDDVVALRPFTHADVPAIVAAVQEPDIPRMTFVPTPYGPYEGTAFVNGVEYDRKRGTLLALAIVSAGEPRRLLGSIGLEHFAQQRTGELGYWLAREARGLGAGTRAVRLLSRYGFERLGLAQLQILPRTDNLASQRVAERAGYRREGVLRSYFEMKDGRADFVLYSLLPGELG